MLNKQEMSILRNHLLDVHDILCELNYEASTQKETELTNEMWRKIEDLIDLDNELEKVEESC